MSARKWTRDDVLAQVRAVLSRILGVPPERVTEDALLVESLGMNSFAGVEMLFELEEATGLQIREDRVPDLKTVGDVATFVHSLTQNPKQERTPESQASEPAPSPPQPASNRASPPTHP